MSKKELPKTICPQCKALKCNQAFRFGSSICAKCINKFRKGLITLGPQKVQDLLSLAPLPVLPINTQEVEQTLPAIQNLSIEEKKVETDVSQPVVQASVPEPIISVNNEAQMTEVETIWARVETLQAEADKWKATSQKMTMLYERLKIRYEALTNKKSGTSESKVEAEEL